MSKSILLIGLIAMCLDVSAADAGQVGRIISHVNFREGANRSARIISVLAPGTKVSILREDPGGWYLAIHQGRPGFLHKNYVNLEGQQNSASRFDSVSGHLAMPVGMILVSIGVIAMVYVLAPFLLTSAVVLVGSLIAVVVLDLAFQLGMLYSLFSVSLGLVIATLFLTRKRAG